MDDTQTYAADEAVCRAWDERWNAGYLDSADAYEELARIAGERAVEVPPYDEFLVYLEKLSEGVYISVEPFHKWEMRITDLDPWPDS